MKSERTGTLYIRNLRDVPHLIPTLACWFHKEWGCFSSYHSIENATIRLSQHNTSSELPLTLIAFLGDEAAGTASIVQHGKEDSKTGNLWLSYVYVNPDYRKLGIGSFVAAEAEKQARLIGQQMIALHTTNQESFFKKLGWETIMKDSFNNPAAVMVKMLKPASMISMQHQSRMHQRNYAQSLPLQ